MKRFVLLLALIPVVSFAQLKVTGIHSPTIQVAKVLRLSLDQGSATIDYSGGSYVLRGETTNEFDVLSFGLFLGNTKEEAAQELRNLASLCDRPVGTTFILKELETIKIHCMVSDFTRRRSVKPSTNGKKGSMLILNEIGYLGEFQITKKQLESLAKQVEKFKEE